MKTPGCTKFNLFLSFVTVFLVLDVYQCIRFEVKPNTVKCLKQEMYPNELAIGEYEISSLPDTVIDLTITDSRGHIALSRESVDGKGKFAVTSDNEDVYDLCFDYKVGGNSAWKSREVSVNFKVGVEAKEEPLDFSTISELERDLNKIGDLSNAIITDYASLKRRAREMRGTNESTNNRVFYQSVTSIIILVVLTTWQIVYLRTFFKTRKLIS